MNIGDYGRSLEIHDDSGSYFNLDLNPDGSFEFSTDNGGDSYRGENQFACARFTAEQAPDILLAITNWIERLNERKES